VLESGPASEVPLLARAASSTPLKALEKDETWNRTKANGATCAAQDDVASCFEYYAGLAEELDRRQWAPVEVGEDGFRSEVLREPLGAVALISPWNYPMLMAVVRRPHARRPTTAALPPPSHTAPPWPLYRERPVLTQQRQTSQLLKLTTIASKHCCVELLALWQKMLW